MQLDTLWQFMQVDMEADGFEARMRQSANRQKLLKQRDFLRDQQANMKKLENDVAVMQDRLEAVKDEAERLEKVLASLSEELENNPPTTPEEVQKQSVPRLKSWMWKVLKSMSFTAQPERSMTVISCWRMHPKL